CCFSMYIFMATFIGLIMNSKCQQTLLKLCRVFECTVFKRECNDDKRTSQVMIFANGDTKKPKLNLG
ncbi:hypothetical protein ABTC04_13415, partial [Acinetobacter baumannii]